MILVKFVCVGQPVQEHEMSDDPTVGALLSRVGMEYKQGCVSINGDEVDKGDELENGDTVYYKENVKGNQTLIKVIRIGQAVVTFAIGENKTVKEIIQMLPQNEAESILNSDKKCEYKVNGVTRDLNYTVVADESAVTLMIMQKTKGNE